MLVNSIGQGINGNLICWNTLEHYWTQIFTNNYKLVI